MDAENKARGEDIDAEQDATIVITRIFDAPRELVFDAWTDPKHLAEWWGPNGFSITTRAFDMQPGGTWRLVMHGPDGRDYENRIVYEEIVRPERLVYRHPGGEDVEPVRFQTTVTFEDLGGKTRLTMRMLFPSAAERQRVAEKYRAVEGGRQTLERLAQYVAARLNAAAARAGGADMAAAAATGQSGLAFGERTVEIVRIIDAPRSLVFEAWTDRAHLTQWWGPNGFTNPVCEIDVRPGGAIHIVMRGPDGAEYPMKGVFREVARPERLVFTNIAVDQDGNHLIDGSTTVFFEELGNKTRLTVRTHAVGRVAYAERKLAGMEVGWTQSIDRLTGHVAPR
jgi:uncharacterized protein YndB with AHSA1/START domain